MNIFICFIAIQSFFQFYSDFVSFELIQYLLIHFNPNFEIDFLLLFEIIFFFMLTLKCFCVRHYDYKIIVVRKFKKIIEEIWKTSI